MVHHPNNQEANRHQSAAEAIHQAVSDVMDTAVDHPVQLDASGNQDPDLDTVADNLHHLRPTQAVQD
jgi:hypothetical protein